MLDTCKKIGVRGGLALGAVGVAVLAEYVFLNVLTLHLHWEVAIYASILVGMLWGMVYMIKTLVPPTPLTLE